MVSWAGIKAFDWTNSLASIAFSTVCANAMALSGLRS
jgi:hypothetical protein